MTNSYSTPRLRLFLPLRLATYVILMVTAVVWMDYPNYLHFQVIIYSLVTLALAASLALEKRFPLHHLTLSLTAVQVLIEISLESAIIYVTGNVNSPFSALFVLTIVSAALAYRMIGTLFVASLVSGAYAFIIWMGLERPPGEGLSIGALETVFSSNEAAFYGILLHILIFFLTAFMSGYLADRLSHQARQLEDTSSALRLAQLETDDILRHLNSGLLTVDAVGRIIFFNRAAERTLAYSEENVRGLPCKDVFAERMPELADCLMMGVTGRVSYPRKELEIISPDGESLPLGLSTSILTERTGELRGIIAIFSDLTEAKEMERKVRANDRLAAVGELSAAIAHEIRNPLAAISGSVEVLQRGIQLAGEDRRLMDLITKESNRLNNILTDFLVYARLERPAYNKVELCHLVSDIRELVLRHDSAGPEVAIRMECDEPVTYVVGDENLLRQLLMNLAINAREALSGKPGEIVLRVAGDRDPSKVHLIVTDDGPGIEAKIVRKIYQPFFSTKKNGTGLGLAIVHRICSVLGLHLAVESTAGRGTVFTIDLQRYGRAANIPRSRSRTDETAPLVLG